MMKTCLIVAGGTLDFEFAGSFLKTEHFDYVVAVDGGLAYLKSLKLLPDAVVGDFDTVDPSILREYRSRQSIFFETHTPEKDETDTQLAIDTAIGLGADAITILGGTGGRIDHMLGNLHLLDTCLLKGIHACMVDRQNRLYLLKEGTSFHRPDTWGRYISFLPLTQEVRGITLEGFRYPLYHKTITIGREAGLCISNELIEEWGRISFDSGILICVESHD